MSSSRSILYSLAFLVGCAALFSLASLLPEIYQYFSLDKEVCVRLEKVEIIELEENWFAPKALYVFENGQKKEEVLETWMENNPYLLEEKMRRWSAGQVRAYCKDGNLNQCTLQKSFPVKQSIYTLILIALAFYFLFLNQERL